MRGNGAAQVRSWTHELTPLGSIRVCIRGAVLAVASHGIAFVAGTADRRIVTAPVPLSAYAEEPGTLFDTQFCGLGNECALCSWSVSDMVGGLSRDAGGRGRPS